MWSQHILFTQRGRKANGIPLLRCRRTAVPPPLHRTRSRWEKPAFVRARLVITLSRVLVKELVDIGVPEERIEVVCRNR